MGRLTGLGHDIPIVFITAHSEDRILPRLLERRAIARLYKPLIEVLLEALDEALAKEAGR